MRRHFLAILAGLWVAAGAQAALPEIAIRSGDKLAFLGDSITAMGTGPSGYCTLVVAGLKANGIEVALIPAGHSGDNSGNMAHRLPFDVIDKKATWMTLSCGVNDVNQVRFGVPLEQFKTNVTGIVTKAQAAGIKVMVLTASPSSENLENVKNQTLARYNDFLREIAKEKKCLLADINADFQKIIKEHKDEDAKSARPGHYLMADDLHPNFERGNAVMARAVLRGFGLGDAEMAKAEEAWLDLPARVTLWPPAVPFQVKVSIRQEALLKELAAEHGMARADQMAGRLLAAEAAGLAVNATAAEIEAGVDAQKSRASTAGKDDGERLLPVLLAHLQTLAAGKAATRAK